MRLLREHAPQALMRWATLAIVGGSFGEIFFGNCVMLGIPCLVTTQADREWLQKADALGAVVRGDIPGISCVIVDGQVRVGRSRNTPLARRLATFTGAAVAAAGH
jgi:3-isopropylmalate/(R)-2-methylmalate dehydratase small subunit